MYMYVCMYVYIYIYIYIYIYTYNLHIKLQFVPPRSTWAAAVTRAGARRGADIVIGGHFIWGGATCLNGQPLIQCHDTDLPMTIYGSAPRAVRRESSS